MESQAPDWPDAGEVATNFDWSIDERMAGRLRREKITARYAGWNFNGLVWWDRDAETFKCEVWRYHIPRWIAEGTLPEIMEAVSNEHGRD